MTNQDANAPKEKKRPHYNMWHFFELMARGTAGAAMPLTKEEIKEEQEENLQHRKKPE